MHQLTFRFGLKLLKPVEFLFSYSLYIRYHNLEQRNWFDLSFKASRIVSYMCDPTYKLYFQLILLNSRNDSRLFQTPLETEWLHGYEDTFIKMWQRGYMVLKLLHACLVHTVDIMT